jgi:hypothetical protein
MKTPGILVGFAFIAMGVFPRADAQPPSDADVMEKITSLEKIVIAEEQAQSGAEMPPAGQAATNTPGAETNTLATVPPENGMNRTPRAVRFLHTMRSYALRKDYLNAINSAHNLETADASDAVQKALADLVPEMQKLNDEQLAQANGAVKSMLDHATAVIKASKAPKDLDALLVEIADAINQNRNGTFSPAKQSVQLQLEGAARFVREWQSYLADKAAGNAMQVTNDLRELANSNDGFFPIPRSEILAMAQTGAAVEPQAVDARIEVHSFDDIPAALGKLQMLQRSGNYSMEMNGLMSSLQSLQNAYASYQDRNYAAALQQLQNNPFGGFGSVSGPVTPAAPEVKASENSLHAEIATLKDTLLVQITQGLLAMPDAPAPAKDERAPDYLLRLAAMKQKAADWIGLQKVLTVDQQVTGMFNPAAWLMEDLSGIHAYLVAQKLEAAGQTLDAIRSYRQSLATLGKFFPADPPAAKLKELEQKYPELYKQALQEPIGKPGTP